MTPGNKLSVSISGTDTIPALGSNGGSFGLFASGAAFGLIAGTLNTGNVFLQAQRIDSTATAYNIFLQPSGGNVTVGGTGTGGGAGVLGISNGTQGSATENMIQLVSEDLSAGNTILSLQAEGSGIVGAGITNTTVTTKIAIKINGTVYYLLATTSAS
jgi:hypothetical protein